MLFIHKPDQLFFSLFILFILFYLGYLIRIYFLAKATGSRFNPVLYKFFLRCTYFSLLLISLSGPFFGSATISIPNTGKKLFILTDLSRSMKATDIQPSRFEKMKSEVKQLLKKIGNTRSGIIIFSSEAYLHAPLTSDKEALNIYTEVLSSDLIEAPGTNFAAPLSLALQKLEEDKAAEPSAIVLFSDGEDFSEEAQKVTEEVRAKNIKIFTVGIGTEEGAEIEKGKTSHLNRKNLEAIAKETEGEYFEISDTKTEMPELIKAINNLSEEKVTLQKMEARVNKYFYFLFLALILMALDVIITVDVIKI
jgi:Ca-activated chloride channel family protein